MYMAASETADWFPGMLACLPPPNVIFRPVANSIVLSRAAWATPIIIGPVTSLPAARPAAYRAAGAAPTQVLPGAGRVNTATRSSGKKTWSSTTSLLIVARKDMACQVFSMRTPSSSSGTIKHRPSGPVGLWSVGAPCTLVISRTQRHR